MLSVWLVMGQGQNFLTQVGSGEPSMVWIWKISPQKCQNFWFISLRIKKNIFGLGLKVHGSKAGRPLIYCGSKVYSGQGPSLLWTKLIAFIFGGSMSYKSSCFKLKIVKIFARFCEISNLKNFYFSWSTSSKINGRMKNSYSFSQKDVFGKKDFHIRY